MKTENLRAIGKQIAEVVGRSIIIFGGLCITLGSLYIGVLSFGIFQTFIFGSNPLGDLWAILLSIPIFSFGVSCFIRTFFKRISMARLLLFITVILGILGAAWERRGAEQAARWAIHKYVIKTGIPTLKIHYGLFGKWLDPEIEIVFESDPAELENNLEGWNAIPIERFERFNTRHLMTANGKPMVPEKMWEKTFPSDRTGCGYPATLAKEKDSNRYKFHRSFNQSLGNSKAD